MVIWTAEEKNDKKFCDYHSSWSHSRKNSDSYDECKDVIRSMRLGDESDLFGKEKDDSFKGSRGNIYQSFDGQDIYSSLEEKAAHLLYFVTKNHSFFDGKNSIGQRNIKLKASSIFKIKKLDAFFNYKFC